MTDNTAFDAIFGSAPLMAIMRGLGVERTLAIATTAWDLGIEVVEVPIQTPTDVQALAVVCRAAAERGTTVGAGTVVSLEHVRQSVAAGASFVVSPGFDVDIVRAAADSGLPPLPGVATASEVQAAMREGLTWMKAFPSSLLGPEWFRAMRGPFPAAQFVATGGLSAANAAAFLDAGVRVVAVGSALEDPMQLPRLAALLERH